MKATIQLHDEVNCTVAGLTTDHTELFSQMYAKHPPGYFFSPAFKLGRWDGFIKYFHRTGKTYVYLLEQIVPKLISLGYEVNIDDHRCGKTVQADKIAEHCFSHILREDGTPIKFRPYQVEGVNSLIENDNGVVVAPTASGKTYMIAALANAYNKQNLKCVVIVPNIDLIEQTIEAFEDLHLPVGEYSGDCKDITKPTTISTWQALQNNPVIMKNFDVVIVDECHGAKGQVITELLNKYGNHIVHRYGLTGSLPKEETDKMAVLIAIGPVRYSIPAHLLIEQGYLATLEITTCQLLEDFEDGYFPDYDAEKSYLQTNKERLQWIANCVREKSNSNKGNVLCLVNNIIFGKKLQKLIPNSIFLYGKDKTEIRKQVYRLFEDQDNLVVIATVQIAGVGISIDRIFNLFLIDLGKSFIRTIQTIGRGLRKGKDKNHVNVTDICSDLKYSKAHVRERTKYYKDASYPHKKVKINYKNS